jgi:hypothetical protein
MPFSRIARPTTGREDMSEEQPRVGLDDVMATREDAQPDPASTPRSPIRRTTTNSSAASSTNASRPDRGGPLRDKS